MAEIVDKILLIMIGTALVSASEITDWAVIAMLTGVIVAALGGCVEDWRIRGAYMVLFLTGCLFVPELMCFVPVIFYDCAMERRAWVSYFSAPMLFFYYYNQGMGIREAMLWMMLLLTAVLLGIRTGKKERLEREMIQLRDTSTELNLVLREKNKNLMEKQDYEIYLATLQERNRIAREIHDNVGHMLSRSILQIGALQAVHKEEPLHGQLVSVNDTLSQAMNSIRESVHDLHDDAIDLRQAIIEETREMTKTYRLSIDYDMSPEVPRNVKYCFIAIVKEAMSNIVKHSNADAITILLREHPGFYQLSIEDNGSRRNSIESEQILNRDIGLSNMKERVEALHGAFRIHNEKGFLIFISIPKEQKNESVGSR